MWISWWHYGPQLELYKLKCLNSIFLVKCTHCHLVSKICHLWLWIPSNPTSNMVGSHCNIFNHIYITNSNHEPHFEDFMHQDTRYVLMHKDPMIQTFLILGQLTGNWDLCLIGALELRFHAKLPTCQCCS